MIYNVRMNYQSQIEVDTAKFSVVEKTSKRRKVNHPYFEAAAVITTDIGGAMDQVAALFTGKIPSSEHYDDKTIDSRIDHIKSLIKVLNRDMLVEYMERVNLILYLISKIYTIYEDATADYERLELTTYSKDLLRIY